MKKPPPLSPAQAAEWWDSLPPMVIKNSIGDYLRWQAAHGKSLLHFAHYLRIAYYAERPRASTIEKRLAPLRELTSMVGRKATP